MSPSLNRNTQPASPDVESPWDVIVFIGRFQPLHRAHLAILHQAAAQAAHVLVILGSAGLARSPKNPFSIAERLRFFKAVWPGVAASYAHRPKLGLADNYDTPEDDAAWAQRIRARVQDYVRQQDLPGTARIALIGHKKDASSFYLDLFPDWHYIDLAAQGLLSATDIRTVYFAIASALEFLPAVVPPPVLQFMREFREGEVFRELQTMYRLQSASQSSPSPSPSL